MADDTARIIVELLDKSGTGTAPPNASAPGAGNIPGSEIVGDFHQQVTAGGAGKQMGAGSVGTPPTLGEKLDRGVDEFQERYDVLQNKLKDIGTRLQDVQQPTQQPQPQSTQIIGSTDKPPSNEMIQRAALDLIQQNSDITARELSEALGIKNQEAASILAQARGQQQQPASTSPQTGSVLDGPLGRFFSSQREMEERFGKPDEAIEIARAQQRMREQAGFKPFTPERDDPRGKLEAGPSGGSGGRGPFDVPPRPFPGHEGPMDVRMGPPGGGTRTGREPVDPAKTQQRPGRQPKQPKTPKQLRGPSAGQRITQSITQNIIGYLGRRGGVAGQTAASLANQAIGSGAIQAAQSAMAPLIGAGAASALTGAGLGVGMGVAAAIALTVGAEMAASRNVNLLREAGISPEVNIADAQAELRQFRANLRSSARLDDETAANIEARSILSEVTQAAVDKVSEPLTQLNTLAAKVSSIPVIGFNKLLNLAGETGIPGAGDKGLDAANKFMDMLLEKFGGIKPPPEPQILTWFADQPFADPPPPFTPERLQDGRRRTVDPATVDFAGLDGLVPRGDF